MRIQTDIDIFSLLEELQAIARNGLNFTSDRYDRERYLKLMNLTTKTYSELLSLPVEVIRGRFERELGYITPKVGASAAVFNEDGEILLMERSDGSGWCLPCGWVEPNEKPVEAVIRETREETGLEIKVKQLVGVITRKPGARNGPHTTLSIVHWCEVTGGELSLSSEGLALNYWQIDAMQNWHANHESHARAAYEMWRSDQMLLSVSD